MKIKIESRKMKKITCSLISLEDSIILELNQLAEIFGDKIYFTPGDNRHHIISNEPIDYDDESVFLSALIEFNNLDSETDEHDFNEEYATFEIIEKVGGWPNVYGKFMLKIENEECDVFEYEVTVPKKSEVYNE